MKQDTAIFSTGRANILIMSLAAALLLATIIQVFILKNSWLDEAVFNYLPVYNTPARTRLFIDISFLGSHRFLIPANLLLIAFFIITKKKWWAIRVAVVSLSSLGLMSLLKNIFQVHRPPLPLVDGITNYSFPSGHAFMSIAFFGLLILWAKETSKNKWLQNLVASFCIALIALIGFTRIYLRVHYTTDVIAGWSAGILWLIFSVLIIEKAKAKIQPY